MAALALFGLTLLLIGAAFAVPVAAHRNGAIGDRDSTVLGASVLCFGLGGMNFAFLVGFYATGDVVGSSLAFGVAPILAGAVGLGVVRRRLSGGSRARWLVGAASLTLAGLPGYFALLVALMVSVVTAVLFLFGLVANPRELMKVLDPRV